jgi:hypothetical protein
VQSYIEGFGCRKLRVGRIITAIPAQHVELGMVGCAIAAKRGFQWNQQIVSKNLMGE